MGVEKCLHRCKHREQELGRKECGGVKWGLTSVYTPDL